MYTLKELRHLDILSRSSSMAEAAARAGLTQSAINQSLSKMEAKLGDALFVRRRNSIQLTRLGEAVVARARAILSEHDRLHFEIAALTRGHLGTIRFGVGPAVASLLLNEAIEHLVASSPGIEPRFRVEFWEECENALLGGEIDVFIGGFPREADDSRFAFTPFFKDPLVCVCRRDHPIWQTEPVAVSDLVGYPILASGIRHFEIWKTLASSDELERMNRNVPASIIANPLTVLPVLRATEHILMTTEMNWRRVCENNPDLDMLPVFDLRGLAHMRFVTLEGKQRSPLEKALIASFRAAASSLAIPLDAS